MNIVKKYNSWYYDREEKGFYGYKIFIIKNQFQVTLPEKGKPFERAGRKAKGSKSEKT